MIQKIDKIYNDGETLESADLNETNDKLNEVIGVANTRTVTPVSEEEFSDMVKKGVLKPGVYGIYEQ